MRWSAADVETYRNENTYIDTVLNPCVIISFGDDALVSGNDREYVQLVASRLETQLKGRLLLMPALTYSQQFPEELNQSLFVSWQKLLLQEGFQHIFFLVRTVRLTNELSTKE